jgi:hypothetical protein
MHAQEVSPHARDAVRIIGELRTMPLSDIAGEEKNGPPARVPNLLQQLNRELRELITAVLNDPHRVSLAQEEMVTSELKRAGWDEIPRIRWNAYGEISDIDFEWRTDHDPPLLVVDTELWVPCGSPDADSTLYVFQKKEREWELVLTADADFDLAGNRSDDAMRYVLSSPDQNGKWILGVANTPPNCPSDPKEVRFRILRPGSSPENPTVLLDRREPFSPRFDAPFGIAVDADKFSLTLGKKRKLDGELGISIFRFDVQGDQVTRVPPLALKPEDFLDEWVKHGWSEVAPWSSASKETELEEWHSKLSVLAPDSTKIEFVQPCPKRGKDEGTWLIGLWIDQKQNRKATDERLYIAISKRIGAFYLDGIEKTRPEGCPGNTRPVMLPEAKLPFW